MIKLKFSVGAKSCTCMLLFFIFSSSAYTQDIRIETRSSSSSSTSITIGEPVAPAPKRSPLQSTVPAPQQSITPTPTAPDQGPFPETQRAYLLPQAAPMRPPVPCKKTVEIADDDIRVKVINNYCAARVINLKTWREGGKTFFQFERSNFCRKR